MLHTSSSQNKKYKEKLIKGEELAKAAEVLPSMENFGEFDIPATAGDCFSKILHEEEFCDVNFLVGPSKEQIRAHRLFLMARSSMFRANFSGRWESGEYIELPQFEPAAFKSFLKVCFGTMHHLIN